MSRDVDAALHLEHLAGVAAPTGDLSSRVTDRPASGDRARAAVQSRTNWAAPVMGGRSSDVHGAGGGLADGRDRVDDAIGGGGVPAAGRTGLPRLGAVDGDVEVRGGR